MTVPGEGAVADHDAGGEHAPSVVELRLYVAGQSPKSMRAVENLRRVCEQHLAGRYRLELIDLLETPALAREDQIIAVPTLVRTSPRPVRRIIGDLSDTAKLLIGLQITATSDPR